MGPEWFKFSESIDGTVWVDESRVSINDIVNARPGGLVRCYGSPADCILYIPAMLDDFGRVAGMVSDAA